MKKLILILALAVTCAACDDSPPPKVTCPDCKVIQKEKPNGDKKTYVKMPDGKLTEPKG